MSQAWKKRRSCLAIASTTSAAYCRARCALTKSISWHEAQCSVKLLVVRLCAKKRYSLHWLCNSTAATYCWPGVSPLFFPDMAKRKRIKLLGVFYRSVKKSTPTGWLIPKPLAMVRMRRFLLWYETHKKTLSCCLWQHGKTTLGTCYSQLFPWHEPQNNG